MSLSIRPLSFALGAEVTGIDLSRGVDAETFAEVRSHFLTHHVLLFRGQGITRQQHVDFSRRFGEPYLQTAQPVTYVQGPEEHPEVQMVVNAPTDDSAARVIGGGWHADRAHYPRAAGASLLRCVELPGVGGDTMFANMHRAYDALSDGMRELLADLYGVYVNQEPAFDTSTPERYRESRAANPAAAHPVVRTHAESGRRSLYISDETYGFVGMTQAESRPLIDYLTATATRPENVYRHQWQPDDLVVWDNRSVLHMALADYDRRKLRHMERVAVIGDESGYEYFGPIGPWPAVEGGGLS